MKPITTLSLMIALFFFCEGLSAQENPFLNMAGKPYRAYYDDLRRQLAGIDSTTPEEAAVIAARMRQAAQQSGEKRWMLEADYYEQLHKLAHSLYLHRQKGELDTYEAAEGAKAISGLLPLLPKAEKIGAWDLSIRIADQIMVTCFVRTRNYEMGFRYALIVEDLLSKVSVVDYPPKSSSYLALERWYNRFGEYDKAKSLCYKAIEDPVTDYISWNSLIHALNDLGGISRNYEHNLNRSDSCYERILAATPPDTTSQEVRSERNLWAYIAKGQLGHNDYLRGDYDRAIPLLAYAVEKVAAHNPYNYSYTAGKAILLADIYVKRNELSLAKNYLDSAYLYITRAPEAAEWHTYYPVLARYYGAKGDVKQALACMDSVLNTRNRYEEDFNLRKLHLAEQRAQQEELEIEKLRTEAYRRSFIIILVFAGVAIALLGLLLHFYRQKRAAYRALVQRIRQWAELTLTEPLLLPSSGKATDGAVVDADYIELKSGTNEAPVSGTADASLSGTTDIPLPGTNHTTRELFDNLEQLFQTGKLYRHPNISLNYAADRIGINRSQLSHIVNEMTGKNFNVYVNEYRVKEAVRIMSLPNSAHLSLEGIAFEAGFNNRKTFHEAFKKTTGLSPSVFRENLQEE